MRELAKNFFKRYRNSILWSIVILVLSLTPGSGYPTVLIPYFDKFVHFVLYGVFSALLISESNPLRMCGRVTRRALLVGLLVSVLMGGLVELMQGTRFIARGCDFFDFVADTCGALFALATYRFFNRLLRGLV